MLYQMLTQRRPFRGETHQELFDEFQHQIAANPSVAADETR